MLTMATKHVMAVGEEGQRPSGPVPQLEGQTQAKMVVKMEDAVISFFHSSFYCRVVTFCALSHSSNKNYIHQHQCLKSQESYKIIS